MNKGRDEAKMVPTSQEADARTLFLLTIPEILAANGTPGGGLPYGTPSLETWTLLITFSKPNVETCNTVPCFPLYALKIPQVASPSRPSALL